MTNTDEILNKYSKQIDNFKKDDGYYEQISTLLTTHLYIEYFINYLIENHFLLKKKILSDNRSYTFSVKLDLIYEKGFIPEWLYFNIRKLNKIRNEFSHNLHFDVLSTDLTFKTDDDGGEIETIDLSKEFSKSTGDDSKRNMLIIMHIPTLTLIILAGYIKRSRI